jgi:hypothetical protein
VWRISAAYIAGFPILFFVVALLGGFIEDHFEGSWGHIATEYVALGLVVLYVIARIPLLVLPCIALRALPPTALVEIHWAAFFPHIG